MANVIIRRYN